MSHRHENWQQNWPSILCAGMTRSGPPGICTLRGEQAMQRSAHQEALLHLTRGLTLLHGLPETPERVQQELGLQLAWDRR